MKACSRRPLSVLPGLAPLIALLFFVGIPRSSEAAAKAWDRGAATNNWGDANNWNPNGIPAAGDDVTLDHSLLGAAYTVLVNVATNALNSLTIDPRTGAFAGGTLTLDVQNNVTSTDLFLKPNAGFDVAIRNGASFFTFRIDRKIEIGIGYAPTGGTVSIGTQVSGNELDLLFTSGAADATLDIGTNLTVAMRMTDSIALGCSLSWISVGSGSTVILDVDAVIVGAATVHLTSQDATFAGRALVVDAGALLTFNNGALSVLSAQIEADGSYGQFGDSDATAEVGTVSGTGTLIVKGSCLFKQPAGGVDGVLFSIAQFEVNEAPATDPLTFEDKLDATFSGTKFEYKAGAWNLGTTAVNDGTVDVAGTSVGLGFQELPRALAGSNNTLSQITISGSGSLLFRASTQIRGNLATGGVGGRARITLNDSSVLNLGDAGADTADVLGSTTAVSPAEIVLNGSSTLNVSGAFSLQSNTSIGGQLFINGSATANIAGAIGVNCAAAANHSGGRLEINGTGRLATGSSLTIQGSNGASTLGGRVLVASTRASPGALFVSGTTTIQAGTVAEGGLTVTTDSLAIFSGAVTIADNGGAAPDAFLDITDVTGSGPEIHFGAGLTVDGLYHSTAGVSTTVFEGAAAQTVSGTASTLSFSSLRFDASGPRSVAFSNADTIYTVRGSLLCQGTAAVTVTSAAARTFLVQGPGATFDNTIAFSASTTVEFAGTSAQVIGGTAAIGPAFQELKFNNSAGGTNLTYSTTGATLVVNGGLTINSSTTLAAASRTIDAKGNVTCGATFTQASGTFQLSGAAAQTLGGTAATGPTFQNLTLINSGGTPNVIYSVTGGTLTVNGTLWVNAITALNAAGKTIRAVGTVTFDSNFTQNSGAFQFGGSAAQTFNGTAGAVVFQDLSFEAAAARTVTISQADTFYTINGNLSAMGAATINVSPAALRTFDVSGNFVFDTAIVFGASSSVRFAGAGAQSLSGATGTGPVFQDLALTVAGIKTLSLPVTANGLLSINAGILAPEGVDGLVHSVDTLTMSGGGISFAAAAIGSYARLSVNSAATLSAGTLVMDTSGANQDRLDFNGPVVFGAGFSSTISGGLITAARGWDDSASPSGFRPTGGVVRFDGSVAGTWTVRQRTPAASRNWFTALEVAGSANTVIYQLRTNIDALYTAADPFLALTDLTVSGGLLDLEDQPADNPNVMVGGAVWIAAGGAIDATDDTGTFKVGGNWTVDGTYTPGFMTVGFNGAGTQNIAASGGACSFESMEVGIDGGAVTVAMTCDVNVNTPGFALIRRGVLSLGGKRLSLVSGAGTFEIGKGFGLSTLRMDSFSILAVEAGATLRMNADGRLETFNTTTASPATITRRGTVGQYSIQVFGTVDLSGYRVYHIDINGMRFFAGSVIARLDYGEWDFPTAGGVFMDFSGYTGGARLNFYGCRFRNSGAAFNAMSAKATVFNPPGEVTFFGWGGELGGEAYDVDPNDPAGRIDWVEEDYVHIRGAVETHYSTLQAALNAAVVAGDAIESRGIRFGDLGGGGVTFPATPNVTLRNALLVNGSILGSGAVPGSRGTLRNCFVALTAGVQNVGTAANTLDFVQNCTVVDESNTAGPRIDAAIVENTLLSGLGGGINAGLQTTNQVGVPLGTYVDPPRRDFHLKAGTGPVDAGTDLTALRGYSDDLDGNARAMGAAWDVGADEFGEAGAIDAVPLWSTAAVAANRFGDFLAPADYDFSNNLLYAGTAGNGAVYNSSLLAIDPATGTVLRSLDLTAAIGGGATNAYVMSVPVMLRNSAAEDLILLSVDTSTPPNGLADKLLVVRDTGAALILYAGFSGNGILDATDGVDAVYEPVGMATWSLETGAYYLYLPAAVGGALTPTRLCKYTFGGVRLWNNVLRVPDHRPPNFYSQGLNRIYTSLTDDPSVGGADIASLQPGTGIVDAATTLGGAPLAVIANSRSSTFISPSSATSWVLTVPDGIQGYAVDGATGVVQWSTLGLGGSPTTQCMNPFAYAYAYVGVGEHICKINRVTGALVEDGAGADWTTADWLRGRISSNLLSFGGRMYFGTERGYCYHLIDPNDTATADGKNGVMTGYPYLVPGARLLGVSFSFAGGKKAYFTADDGRIIGFSIP